MHGVPEIRHNFIGHPGGIPPPETWRATPRSYETISPEPGRGESDLPGVRDAGRRGAKEAGSSGRGPAVPKEDKRSPASGGDAC